MCRAGRCAQELLMSESLRSARGWTWRAFDSKVPEGLEIDSFWLRTWTALCCFPSGFVGCEAETCLMLCFV